MGEGGDGDLAGAERGPADVVQPGVELEPAVFEGVGRPAGYVVLLQHQHLSQPSNTVVAAGKGSGYGVKGERDCGGVCMDA